MSGGVDSSVAAYLLKDAGYDVIGITMRLSSIEDPDYSRRNKGCCSAQDTSDARRVCGVLDIPHYVLNFEKEFHTHVVQYFIDEYRRGRTPNPCIACNDHVKFRFFIDKARALGAEKLATGHYARIDRTAHGYRLLRARDPGKDQSYVLYGLGQRELEYLLFPVGEHSKPDIRRTAQKLRLPNADKPDSQDICFIPDGDYRGFVRKHVDAHPGEILDTSGNVLGDHNGVELFTIGQRKGLGISSPSPRYVVDIVPEENVVVVGEKDDLLCRSLVASSVRYTSGATPDAALPITAKVRHHAPEAAVELTPSGDSAEVRFATPQRAVAPGQAIVFYHGEEVIGGGVIDSTSPVQSDRSMSVSGTR
jgi:tRNA-specific 2-thiouridylase